MVLPRGIEPRSLVLQTSAMTTSAKAGEGFLLAMIGLESCCNQLAKGTVKELWLSNRLDPNNVAEYFHAWQQFVLLPCRDDYLGWLVYQVKFVNLT